MQDEFHCATQLRALADMVQAKEVESVVVFFVSKKQGSAFVYAKSAQEVFDLVEDGMVAMFGKEVENAQPN